MVKVDSIIVFSSKSLSSLEYILLIGNESVILVAFLNPYPLYIDESRKYVMLVWQLFIMIALKNMPKHDTFFYKIRHPTIYGNKNDVYDKCQECGCILSVLVGFGMCVYDLLFLWHCLLF